MRNIQMDIFRGQCLNNACTMLGAQLQTTGGNIILDMDAVYKFAEKMYDEGIKRNWMNYGTDIESKATLKNPLTDKDNVGKEQEEVLI